jgi:TolA-binding protein
MKRLVPIFALLLVAATAEEVRSYRAGRAALEDRIYDVAERNLTEFIQKFPNSDRANDAHLLLAQAQFFQGKWQAAVQTTEAALSKWPEWKPDSLRFWQAEALSAGGKFGAAETRYAEVAEKFPRSTFRDPAWFGLAFVQFKQAHYEIAEQTLDKLLKFNPRPELAQDATVLRGQIYLALGKFEQADAAFEDVIKKASGSRPFYRAHLWTAESLMRRGQFDEAIKHDSIVLDAFKAKPNRPVDAQLAAEAWYNVGWTYWRDGKFDNAADGFLQALTNAQSEQLKRDALLKLGEAYARAGEISDGISKLKEFLQVHPADPIADEVQMAIGNLWFENKNYAAALPEYAALVSNYPQSSLVARGNFNAGWAAWRLDQNEEALKYFQQAFALTRDPAIASESLFKVADAQYGLGRFADAVISYQQFISTYSDNKQIDRALFQLAQAYDKLRNADAAIATFESLVKQFPQTALAPEAQFFIGQIYVGLGRENDARTAFRAVLRNFAESSWTGNAALAIGQSFYREGKYDEALAELEPLSARGPDDELAQRALYHRGWAWIMKGQLETKTLPLFTEFLKAYPQSPVAADVQFWVADYYLGKKDYVKAQEQFQSLAENHPASALADKAQYFAARAAYSRQDFKTAIDLFEGLLKKFPESSFRCDARFGEGDALTELNQFDNALIVFDTLVKQFPDCYLICEALGRKGDCQATLNRHEDAIATFRKALDCSQDPTVRNQLLWKLGLSLERAGKLDEALQAYAKPLYEATAATDTSEPPERFWLCKAARDAARVKEQQQQWRDAITLYQKLTESCPDMKTLAEDKIRRIRTEHVILF